MKLSIKAGTTSKLLDIFVLDSSSTTGAGLTGLVFNTASLSGYYYREGAASAVAITLATMTLGTWATGGFVVVDGTNMPGCYQIGVPDAAIAAGAKSVIIMLKGASNLAPLLIEVELTAVDNQSANAFITGVNSIAPPTNWNLTSIDSNGRLDIIKIAGTTQTARDIGASVLLSSGTGTGQISLSSGLVALSGTQTFNNTGTWTGNIVGTLSTLTTYTGNTPQTGDSYARLGAPAGASVSADIAAISTSVAAVPTTGQIATAVFTTQMTEAYAALGVSPTLAQILFEARGLLAEKSVSGTTLTMNGINGVTAKETFVLNSATTPTAITRSA